MTHRLRTALLAILSPALLLLVSGCEPGQDDEMVPPTRTVTASPSPDVTAVPDTVPTGRGVVAPDVVVWASGNTLHVGRRSVDLAPVGLDGFVAVPGGVYVVRDGRLWFTDLTRLKDTGITGVTRLGATADASRILVDVATPGAGATYAFDAVTGSAVSPDGLTPVTAAERLRGPDRRGVVVPLGFRLAGWAGPRTFYGTAGAAGRPTSVVGCDLRTRSCDRVGTAAGTDPVVFGTGWSR
jgi:hypothetical protein